MILPLKKMNEGVAIAALDSDINLFIKLMAAGEQLLKLITCAMLAGIIEDKEDSKYSLCYALVRADSIGIWDQSVQSILSNAKLKHIEELNPVWQDLTQKSSNPSWQYGALVAINSCVKVLKTDQEDLPVKSQLKNWFSLFVELRNEGRAHGFPSAKQISEICPNLEKSLNLITKNLTLFDLPWLYIKQNISGEYRVTPLNENSNGTNWSSIIKDFVLVDGIYLYAKQPLQIELIDSSVEALDFFIPNGNFKDKSYECLSYISGQKIFKPSEPYLKPPGQKPSSETEGKGHLYVINNTFTNLPFLQSIYINRKKLEKELEEKLLIPDRYPTITLSGRGGIGKTSLALHILRAICNTERFMAIIWFSARDIDLLEEGPKIVKQQIIDELDIAKMFTRLLEPSDAGDKGFDHKKYMENELRSSGGESNGPILFVLDNFETVRNPKQVYQWLDTHVRNPNKILITSRLRDFKADYPIVVDGMSRVEFNDLVERVSTTLGIRALLTADFLDELYKESDGHPYVVKVLLGEVSKQNKLRHVKRIIASKNEMLNALFERTYSDLSLSAKRVFLTLCCWRTILPQLAIEATLICNEDDIPRVEEAIDELYRFSFIEKITSNCDESTFISVPLTAYEFGREKLNVSPLKTKINLDIQTLNYFGVTQITDINKGLHPKIEHFFKSIAIKIKGQGSELKRNLPLLEFICRNFPEAWSILANIYFEINDISKAIGSLQNYVADHRTTIVQKAKAWGLLSKYYSLNKDIDGEAQAYAELCELENLDFAELSNAVHGLMNLFKENKKHFKKEYRNLLMSKVAGIMKMRIDAGEGVTSDLTKLAWVYIHCDNKSKAKTLVEQALGKDSSHFHALNLAKILKIRRRKIDWWD